MNNIFFDWSGTIKDAFFAHHWVVDSIFKKLGKTGISEIELKNEWVEPYMNFFNKYFPSMTVDEEKELYSSFVYSNNYPGSVPINGMLEVVNELRQQGHNLFLVTSDIESSVTKEINEYKLNNIFTKIYAEVYDKSKPISDTIKSEGFDKDKTYLIGDSTNEIKVAKKVGIKSIAVTWGFTLKDKLLAEDPDFVVEKPSDMLDLLK